MVSGKCPKCDHAITHARIEGIPLNEPGVIEETLKGVAYLCPHCLSVLSVGIDPLALQNDLIQGVLDALRKDSI